jgi:hypothetical protein
MTDASSGATNYSSNSNRDKQKEPPPREPVERITTGEAVVRKKPLGRRIAENFTGADGHDVGHYVLFNVILPRVKDMILDAGESALRRALFGDGPSGYSSRSPVAGKGYTPYNSIASSAVPKQPSFKAPTPASDEFGEILVENRGDAQEVMDKMGYLIETYGMACVSDLKAAVGLTPSMTDEKFGWMAMGGTDIRRVGGSNPGYLLVFPRPIELP